MEGLNDILTIDQPACIYGSSCYSGKCRRWHPPGTFPDRFVKLFHQTDDTRAASIVSSQSFARGKAGINGGGIYFAESAAATHLKAHQRGKILVSTVNIGRVRHHRHGVNPNMTIARLRQLGFSSIRQDGVISTGPERVIFSAKQITDIRVYDENDNLPTEEFKVGDLVRLPSGELAAITTDKGLEYGLKVPYQVVTFAGKYSSHRAADFVKVGRPQVGDEVLLPHGRRGELIEDNPNHKFPFMVDTPRRALCVWPTEYKQAGFVVGNKVALWTVRINSGPAVYGKIIGDDGSPRPFEVKRLDTGKVARYMPEEIIFVSDTCEEQEQEQETPEQPEVKQQEEEDNDWSKHGNEEEEEEEGWRGYLAAGKSKHRAQREEWRSDPAEPPSHQARSKPKRKQTHRDQMEFDCWL
jgi:hypothetical protein